MKRREFIALMGSAAVWPLTARAQQPALPVIGFLRSATFDDASHIVAAEVLPICSLGSKALGVCK